MFNIKPTQVLEDRGPAKGNGDKSKEWSGFLLTCHFGNWKQNMEMFRDGTKEYGIWTGIPGLDNLAFLSHQS